MSINIYSGRPGSGKTYQVVTSVILPHLSDGRRVVTNIPVISDNIYNHLLSEGKEFSSIGQLVVLPESTSLVDGFFPTMSSVKNQSNDSFVMAGDLVVIDEVWEIFGANAKISSDSSSFQYLRYHRHHKNQETGLCTDIVLISQDVMDIHIKVRRVVDYTYLVTKQTQLGLSSVYTVHSFRGGTTRGKSISEFAGKYEKKYFLLYSSHDGSSEISPLESTIDKRGNIFNSTQFRLFLFFTVFFIIFIFWFINYLSNWSPHDKYNPQSQPETQTQFTPDNTNFAQFSQHSTHSNIPSVDENYKNFDDIPQPRPVLSLPLHSEYSIIGHYIDSDEDMRILIDLGDYRKTIKVFPETDYDNFYYDGIHIMYVYGDHVVTNYSGNFRGTPDSIGFSNTLPSSFGQ